MVKLADWKFCGLLLLSFSETGKSLAPMLSPKFLIVGEKIIPSNPFRSSVIGYQLDFVIEQIGHDCPGDYQITKVLSEHVEDGFKKAAEAAAELVTGYVYSDEAMEAATIAKNRKITYLSPVSPLDSLNGAHSKTLAAPHSQLAKAFSKIAKDFRYPKILLKTNTNLINLGYSELMGRAFVIDKMVNDRNDGTEAIAITDFIKEFALNKVLVIFSGYAFEQLDTIRLLAQDDRDKIVFLAHPQWVYGTQTVRKNLQDIDVQLYAVTDFIDHTVLAEGDLGFNPLAKAKALKLKKAIAKKLAPKMQAHELDEPVVYALYDMLAIAVEKMVLRTFLWVKADASNLALYKGRLI